ncbi:hypothetical protein K420107F6_28280 [Lactonifactor longoviformis]
MELEQLHFFTAPFYTILWYNYVIWYRIPAVFRYEFFDGGTIYEKKNNCLIVGCGNGGFRT